MSLANYDERDEQAANILTNLALMCQHLYKSGCESKIAYAVSAASDSASRLLQAKIIPEKFAPNLAYILGNILSVGQ